MQKLVLKTAFKSNYTAVWRGVFSQQMLQCGVEPNPSNFGEDSNVFN